MFTIDNFVIDRVLHAYVLDKPNGDLLGYIDQMSEATINMDAEEQNVNDATGVLIRKFMRSKSASLESTNVLFNLNVAALSLGSVSTIADGTAVNKFTMPADIEVKSGTTAKLQGCVEGTNDASGNARAGYIHVYGLTNSGSKTKEYTKGTTASATQFAYDATTKTFTPPTASDEVKYFVYYTREVEDNGMKWVNSADKFPDTVAIVIVALGYDVCDMSTPLKLIISGDSFQISASNSITLSGGETQEINFNGDFQSSYCSEDKSLFTIYIAKDEDEEEEASETPAAPTYTAVTDPTGNPQSQGWYEESDGVYTLTTDTTVDSGKTYYTKNA